jgi:hypothetical protein
MLHMKWQVEGADTATGEDLTLTIEAHTAGEAEFKARSRGILVSAVNPVLVAVAATPPPLPQHPQVVTQINATPPDPYAYHFKAQAGRMTAAGIGCGVFAICITVFVVVAGLFFLAMFVAAFRRAKGVP